MVFPLLLDKKGAGVSDDAGAGAAAAFALTDLPGLATLVDPHEQAGSDGDPVASVDDQFGHTYAQATGTKQPTLKTGANGINGQNIFRFDSGDLLVAPSAFLTSTLGYVFAVFKTDATLPANQTLFASFDELTVAAKGMLFYARESATRTKIYQKNNDTADEIRGSTDILANTTYLYIWKSSGSAYTFRLNGSDETPLTIVAGANNGDWFGDCADRDNVTIGAGKWSGESQFLVGDLALLGAGEGEVLTDEWQAELEDYVETRFGLNFP